MKTCAPLLLFAAGCATTATPRPAVAPPAATYRFNAPDVLDVAFLDHPAWDAVASIDLDGGLPLGPAGKPFVAGQTVEEATATIAEVARVEPDRVHATLADARAGHVYITGPQNGRRRVVAYRGPEPVAELLRRAGITDPREVTVVRGNVAAGGGTVVVEDAVNETVALADQIYVGESRRASFGRLLPPWLRPLYERLWRVVTTT